MFHTAKSKGRTKPQAASSDKSTRYSSALLLIISLIGSVLTIGATAAITVAPVNDSPATLSIGTTVGMPGERVTLAVSLEAGATLVRSAQVNLAYDSGILTNPVVVRGVATPDTWFFDSNSVAAGDLRVVTFDPAGNSTLAAAIAAATGAYFSTMPGPPPYGRSSTVR